MRLILFENVEVTLPLKDSQTDQIRSRMTEKRLAEIGGEHSFSSWICGKTFIQNNVTQKPSEFFSNWRNQLLFLKFFLFAHFWKKN